MRKILLSLLLVIFLSNSIFAAEDYVINPETGNIDTIGMSASDITENDARYLKLDCSNDPLTAELDLPGLFNSLGDLKIMPDVQGDVTLFGDTDVGDGDDGKKLIIHRKAAEGDEYAQIYVVANKRTIFSGSDDTLFSAGGNLDMEPGSGQDFRFDKNCIGNGMTFFGAASSGENNYIRQAGYITNGADELWIAWTVKDTDDYFWLERESANILGFKIDMPVDLVDNSLTTTGTITCDTLNYTTLNPAIVHLTVGTDNQIPYSNAAGDDFDYSAAFTFDGTDLKLLANSSKLYFGGSSDAYFEFDGTDLNCSPGGDFYIGDGGAVRIEATSNYQKFLRFITSPSDLEYYWRCDKHGVGNDLEFWGPAGKIYQIYDTGDDIIYYGDAGFGQASGNPMYLGKITSWFTTTKHGLFSTDGGIESSGGLAFQSRGNLARDIIFGANDGAGSTRTIFRMYAEGNVLQAIDSAKFFWGASQDVSISFDTADMIINSEEVTANDEIHFTNFDKYTFDNDVTSTGTLTTTGTIKSETGIDVGDAGGFSGMKFDAANTHLTFWIDGTQVAHIAADGTYNDDVP